MTENSKIVPDTEENDYRCCPKCPVYNECLKDNE